MVSGVWWVASNISVTTLLVFIAVKVQPFIDYGEVDHYQSLFIIITFVLFLFISWLSSKNIYACKNKINSYKKQEKNNRENRKIQREQRKIDKVQVEIKNKLQQAFYNKKLPHLQYVPEQYIPEQDIPYLSFSDNIRELEKKVYVQRTKLICIFIQYLLFNYFMFKATFLELMAFQVATIFIIFLLRRTRK